MVTLFSLNVNAVHRLEFEHRNRKKEKRELEAYEAFHNLNNETL